MFETFNPPPETEPEPKVKVKSSILVAAEVIYEDGRVRVDVRSARPWNDTHHFPVSPRVRAEAAGKVLDEFKKFMSRTERA